MVARAPTRRRQTQLLDPKVNFTWVKGQRDEFGYEYEHIWMAVNDNNPLTVRSGFTSDYTNTGGTSVADITGQISSSESPLCTGELFRPISFIVDNVYAQDDWRITPKFSTKMRWEYGSRSEENNYILTSTPFPRPCSRLPGGRKRWDNTFHGGGATATRWLTPFTDFDRVWRIYG